jgi:hypothetical protein
VPCLVIALGAVAVAGCGSSAPKQAVAPNGPEISPSGDIPDSQAYVAYRVPAQRLTLKVPEGWAQRSRQGSITFTDKLNTIAVRVVGAAKAPTPGPVSAPRGAHVSVVHRSAGPAVRVAYLARSAADPVTGRTRADAVERYLFFHAGRELVLTLSGPKGADNVDPWRLVTDSVTWR